MGESAPAPLTARLQLLAAAALFSTGGAAIKAVDLDGWQVACLRSGVAAAVVFIALPAARKRWTPAVAGVGVVYAATMVLFVLGNKLTTAAATIFLQSTAPLYLLLLAPLVLHEPVRRRDLAYMAALAAGLGLFFVGVDEPSATAPDPLAGNLMATASGVTWALTMLGLRALGRSEPGAGGAAPAAGGPASAAGGSEPAANSSERPAGDAAAAPAPRAPGRGTGIQAVFAGNLVAFLVCLGPALPFPGLGSGAAAPGAAVDWVDWTLIGYLGAFQIGLAYILLTRGVRHVTALEAALLLLVEPVLNPVWAWLVHGESPGGWSMAGGAVILTATAAKTVLDFRRARRGQSGP